MSALIELQNLTTSFGDVHVLRGADLTLDEWKVTALVGRSGTGKSVMFKCMMGLIEPAEGRVIYQGQDLHELDEDALAEVRRSFGYAFQDDALFDSTNVGENIAFPLREVLGVRKRRELRERVAEMLDWIELPGIEKKLPSELSGGMRKRVGIARALAIKPKVLLFDEPTSGLDPVLGQTINDLVLRVNKELGLTCILITHDIPAAFRISDRVVFLYDGEVIAQGAPSEATVPRNEATNSPAVPGIPRDAPAAA